MFSSIRASVVKGIVQTTSGVEGKRTDLGVIV